MTIEENDYIQILLLPTFLYSTGDKQQIWQYIQIEHKMVILAWEIMGEESGYISTLLSPAFFDNTGN